MSELWLENELIFVADFGSENPFPQFSERAQGHLATTADIPEDMEENLAYGHLPGILPYTLQDGYNRQRRLTPVKVAVLENDILSARFLIQYGGRLWSLFHRPSKKELLYQNRVIQPGNLALRNAWFCGGVEWNIGTTGHTPFTCTPLFTARLNLPDGNPVLRMYEYERWRGVTYQIDAFLPDHSPVLFVHISINNPNPGEVPIYWWSNIAVPEADDVRVVVPADNAFHFDLERHGLGLVPTPIYQGVDYTYSKHTNHASDFFFNIPEGRQPYIAAIDGSGIGLVQTSTARQKGRKLFFWGTGSGGKRWQDFLSPLGGSYLEIQAGLARTQLEHLPMPGRSRWSWTEAYGLLQAEPMCIHGKDWLSSQNEVESRLVELIPSKDLESWHLRGMEIEELPIDQIWLRGSSWGFIEEFRRQKANGIRLGGIHLVFERQSLTDKMGMWISLLENGTMQEFENEIPTGFQVSSEWKELLLQSINKNGKKDWLIWYFLGVIYYYEKAHAQARDAWQQSLEIKRTPWNLRCLAYLSWKNGEIIMANKYYGQALKLLPGNYPFLIEYGRFLLETGRENKFLKIISESPKDLQLNGRIRFMAAKAALKLNRLSFVEKFFKDQVEIADLREGEDSLSSLWIEYQMHRNERNFNKVGLSKEENQEKFPLPKYYDFRMIAD